MTPIRIVKGLDVPIAGAPEQTISDGPEVSTVALVGADYAGLKPMMRIAEGVQVELGQPLFADRKDERIQFTAPGYGRVAAVNRGARRALVSVVIRLGGDSEIKFSSWRRDRLATLRRDQVAELLLASGLWTALRQRPYGGRADPDKIPRVIFVTAMDSNPLAADAEIIINAEGDAFADGLTVISQLTEGSVYVCQTPRAGLPTGNRENVRPVEFSGPHPSGIVGTHIHFLAPASADRAVWHLSYQDVIAIGKLFTTGRLPVDRVISLAGPNVARPRLIRARLGASTDELVEGELTGRASHVISGSVLSGRQAVGPEAYLGRFHNQVSVIDAKNSDTFTAYDARVTGRPLKRKFQFGAVQNGPSMPLVPFGGYDRVMPLDILATPLTRALLVGDTDMAQALGCLELDEEDLALCSFACPSKIDHGVLLRRALEQIEKEG